MIALRAGSFALVVVLLASNLAGCGWMRSLRGEAYEDEAEGWKDKKYSYQDARNKRIPKPATVLDSHLTAVEGTPVDLSGIRAKSGRVTRADFDSLAARNENSLWKDDGQSNFFFASNQARVPGDIVTIEVEDALKKDMITEFKKIMSDEDIDNGYVLDGIGPVGPKKLPEGQTAVASAVNKTSEADAAAGGERAPAAEGEAPSRVTMTGEILQRFPNGNVLIRGVKRVPYDNRMRMLEVTAIVKGTDIAENETVKSSRFYESRTEVYK